MYCTKCGQRMREEDQFCESCGHAAESPKIDFPSSEATNSNLHDQLLVETFIGEKKKAYYLNKWTKEKFQAWNWAAAFASIFWLGYRKMYKVIFTILFLFLAIDVLVALLGIENSALDSSIGTSVGIILGMTGNSLYEKFVKKRIESLKPQYSGSDLLTQVEKQGGTSWKGFWVSVLLFVTYGFVSSFTTSFIEEVKNGEQKAEMTIVDSSSNQHELNLIEYFPVAGTTRSYISYGENGSPFYWTDEFFKVMHGSGQELVEIQSYDEVFQDSIKQFTISEEEVRLVYLQNQLVGEQEVSELVLAKRKEWATGDVNNSMSYLKEINITMAVPAGEFENVLKVVNEVELKQGIYQTIDYYAPKIGLIKSEFISEKGDTGIIKELATYEIPAIGSSETAEEDVQNTSTFTNEKFGFSFVYPTRWQDNLAVEIGNWAPDAEQTVDFSYVNTQKKIQQPVFSIVIYEGDVDPSYFEHVGWYLGTDEVYTFALELAGEANEDFLHPDNSEDLKNVQEIMEEIEQVMLSFELN